MEDSYMADLLNFKDTLTRLMPDVHTIDLVNGDKILGTATLKPSEVILNNMYADKPVLEVPVTITKGDYQNTFKHVLSPFTVGKNTKLARITKALGEAIVQPFSYATLGNPRGMFRCGSCDGRRYKEDRFGTYAPISRLDDILNHNRTMLVLWGDNPGRSVVAKYIMGHLACVLSSAYPIGKLVPSDVVDKVKKFCNDQLVDMYSDLWFVTNTELVITVNINRPTLQYGKTSNVFIVNYENEKYKRISKNKSPMLALLEGLLE